MRQVGGYWDMAASLVLHGALNEELFLQPGSSGEMFFFFAKIYPFLKEFRQKTNNPDAFANIEKLATAGIAARIRGGSQAIGLTTCRPLRCGAVDASS